MGEWREVRLGDVARVIGGGTPKADNPTNFGGDIPWLTPKDLSKNVARYVTGGERTLSIIGLKGSSARLLPPGAVLLTTRAPIGYVAIAATQVSTNQGFRSLVLNDTQSSEFWYYLLLASRDYLEKHANGSTFKELSGSILANLTFRIPPLSEQRAIAEVLGALDDKIEANRKLSDTAIDYAMSWSSAVLSRCDGAMVAIEDVAHIVKGVSYRSEDLIPGDGWLVSLKCFGRNGKFQSEGLKPFSGQAKNEQVVEPHDVVVAQTDVTQRADVIGRTIRIPSTKKVGRLVASLDCVIVRPYSPLTREMVFAILSQKSFRDHAHGYCNGTTVLHMNSRAVPSYEFPMPSIQIIKQTTSILSSLFEYSESVMEENILLANLRDTLLPKLLSGELKVKDAESIVEEVT